MKIAKFFPGTKSPTCLSYANKEWRGKQNGGENESGMMIEAGKGETGQFSGGQKEQEKENASQYFRF
jgi:hypothetical protein